LARFVRVFSLFEPMLIQTSAFISGMLLSLSLIVAIGPQNAHVLRMGLARQHVGITVLACSVTDWLLIGIGVAGLAQLGKLSGAATSAIIIGACLFLLHYGWNAARRAMAGAYTGLQASEAAVTSPRKALATALAFSWLNPHAWLDTAVIIGTASLAYAAPLNGWFGVGAALGSTLWFVALGGGAQLLARRLAHPHAWRAIDALVAVTMWGTALWLLWGVYRA
jgi:L-lysine exporter family protein LysE/ArgO